ncbi:MAG: methyltransferase domain-containing protein [Bdellovibrionaceae bacterium]|nr:methyltransferase domain-containing protein [Pseudobdellovibrionaceae bacterium]
MIHEKAAVGFDRAGEEYHKGRPEYPPESVSFVIDHLGLTPESSIVEVGAGTGKFTKLLFERGLNVIATEPVPGMRTKFQELLPTAKIIDGTAENLTLPGMSADVIIAAQAFHWFEGPRALAEFARILKPGGAICLIWNARDESIDWVAKLTDIIDPHEGSAPRYKSGAWRKAFEGVTVFTPLEHRSFFHSQIGDQDMLVNRVTSISFISALPEETRREVIAQVRKLAANHPDLKGRSQVEIPYRTDIYWCRKMNYEAG